MIKQTIKKLLIVFSLLSIFPTALLAEKIDTDNDGLSDQQETDIYHTNPNLADTDGDGYLDGQEIANGYSPLHKDKKLIEVDTDKDYLPDAWEIALGTNLTNPDSDGDKYLDGTEIAAGYDPLNASATAKKTKTIKVNLKSQSLVYFFGDKQLESFLISSGIARLPTPTGNFTIQNKYPTKHYKGADYDYPNTKWNLHFYTGAYRYYIHGAYWHNDFGKPKSHGCINVNYDNMERLYNWTQTGTTVLID
ncbi:L,D-transpeptidase family protein [Patescibacteria group bacterium]|nr:L,D-transpeptidase family protein [Patescibacteria group bacterium]